jgi:PAS domain S-box-containing protein
MRFDYDGSLRQLPDGMVVSYAILNTLQESVFLMDDSFKLTWYNRACDELCYQIAGKHITENFDFNELLTINQHFRFRDYYNKALTGECAEFEWYYKRASKWLGVSLYPFRDGTPFTGICGTIRDITERKLNDQVLLRNTSVLNNIDQGVVLTDANFKIIAYNGKAHEIVREFGTELRIGLEALNYLPPERRATAAKNHAAALKGISAEYEALYPNNKWFLINFQPVNNKGGRIKQVSVTFKDITGQKKIQAEMKILSMVARETLNAVMIMRPTGEMVWVNEGFTRLTGFTLDDVLNSRAPMYGPETNMESLQQMKEAREKGTPFRGEQVSYTKQGKKMYTRVEGQPLKDDDGKVNSMFVMITDITEEKRVMEEMEVLSLVAKETSNGIMFFDKLSGKTLWINDGFTRLTGYGPRDIIGKNPVAVLQGPETNRELLDYMTSRIQKDLPYNGDLVIYTKDGKKRLHHVTGQPFKDIKGTITKYFAISTDITDRQRLEEERLQAEIELQREITRVTLETQEEERNQLGRELHDNISQILAAVNMQVGHCLNYYEEGRPLLENVQDNLKEAIQELRKLSHRMVMPRFAESHLNDKLKKLLDNFNNGQVIHLNTCGWTEEKIPVFIKETFFRVAQEQLNNINKYAQANEIVVQIGNSNHEATLLIRDNGIGFDTKQERSGIGLSNIISRVELYKGTAKIISAPGKGCVLSINIPLPTGS